MAQRVWVVEYQFKDGGPSGIRGSGTQVVAFERKRDAEEEAASLMVQYPNTDYKAVPYIREEESGG